VTDWTKWTGEGLEKRRRQLNKEIEEHRQFATQLKFIMQYHDRKMSDLERVVGQIKREQVRRAT